MVATQDEISSTEKLLELIRSEDNTEVEYPDSVAPPHPPKSLKTALIKAWPLKKKGITVGVDFGYKELKLVKVRQSSDKQWVLLGYTSVPFDPEIPKQAHEFATFLNDTLMEFCSSSRKSELWCLLSSAKVEIRHTRIPKVPKKQVANAVYWTAKKEISFDEKQSVFDFEILGDVTEEGIQKTSVMVYTAPRNEIEQLQELFSRSGFPLTGISIGPFAIQNLLRTNWLETGEDTVPSLHISGDWSRIDIFSSGSLVFTRGIKVGINSLIQGIKEGLGHAQKRDIPGTLEIEVPIEMDHARKILFRLIPDCPPLTKSDPGFDLKKEEIFRMILPALERLVSQIERSLKHYSLQLGNESISKIYLSGEICVFERLVDYISEQIGLSSEIIDPFVPGSPFIGEVSTPSSISERASFAHSVGMALSNSFRTLNCIFTYREKEQLARIAHTNRGIIAAFVFMMIICVGIVIWQGRIAEGKKAKAIALSRQMEQYSPCINQSIILQLAANAKRNSYSLKEYSRKYLGMAVIGEISKMTPSNIRLLGITANLGRISGDKDKLPTKTVVLEGLVFGDQQTFNASLATYLVKLENAPLFSQPSIHKSTVEYHDKKKVLHFTVHMKLV